MKAAAGSPAVPRQMKYEEQKVLASLPAAVREQFLALDPAERRFILTASEAEREAYQEMAPDEQTLFATLPPSLRGAWLSLTAAERLFARAAPPEELHGLLALRPDERRARLAASPSAVEGRERTSRLASVAARLAHEVIDGLSAWADGAPSTVEAAGAAAFNALHSGASTEEARGAAMRAVLALPQAARRLEDALGAQLGQTTVQRARPLLPQLVAEATVDADSGAEVAHRLVEVLGAWAGRTAARAVPLKTAEPLTVSVGLRASYIHG
jgi:hypothetical protein